MVGLALFAAAQQSISKYQGTPMTSTQSESQGLNFCRLTGSNGLNLTITLPQSNSAFDYTLMLWFRLSSSSNFGYQTLFQIPNGPSCNLFSTVIQCSTGQQLQLNLLPELGIWMQLTYVTNFTSNSSTLQINYPESHVNSSGTYMNITQNYVLLGFNSSQTAKQGFKGDFREFYMNVGAINHLVIPNVIHMNRVFQMACMAYYQFDPSIGYLQDTFRFQKATQIVQFETEPVEFKSEQVTNPTCSTLDLNRFQDLPTFDTSYSPNSITMANFTSATQNYQYTASLWIKNLGQQNYTTLIAQGVLYCNFLRIPGVFTMFFDSQTSFRVNVASDVDEFSYTSPSIFLPLNEWVNIQMNLNSNTGLNVMVFNSNGGRLQNVTYKHEVLKQQPTNSLIVFQNFFGSAKSLQLWEANYPLPLTAIQLNSTFGLRVNFDFEQSNYGNNSKKGFGWTDLNLNRTLMTGRIGYGFYFSQMKVPNVRNVNFVSPSRIGTLTAQTDLWDGLGCNQSIKYIYTFNTLQQNVKVPQSNQISAELWFSFQSQPSLNTTINLLYLKSGSTSSMRIYIQNGILMCDPFGNNFFDDILVYKNIQPLIQSGWQHVSCSFTEKQKVQGQYLSYDVSTTSTQSSLLPLTFGNSLQKSNKTTPNSKQSVIFQVTIGDQVQVVSFKEVRIWNKYRNSGDLYSYRFKQIDSTEQNLIVYYKFVNGNRTIINEAGFGGFANSTNLTVNTIVSTQNQLLICPIDKYFDLRVQGCIANPFDAIPITYISKYTQQSGLQQVYTNEYQQSSVLLQGYQPLVNQKWQLSNSALDKSLVTIQRSAYQLILPANILGDGYEYNLTSNLQSQSNSFWQQNVQAIYPRRCLYMVDQATQQSVRQLVFNVSQTLANQDICFRMQILQVNGCYDNYYDSLQMKAQVFSSPYIANLQELAQVQVNTQNQTISVCFTQQSIQLAMPKNQQVNLIFSALWSSTQDKNVKTLSYVNNVYKTTFLEQININTNVLTQFNGIQDSISIDASPSAFASGRQTGLMFDWICPQILTDLCANFYGSPVIEITQEMFQKIGGASTYNYTFTVLVWSLSLGTDSSAPNTVFKQQVLINWSKIVLPRFNIVLNQLQGQSSPAIVATKKSTVSIQLLNYRNTDPNVTFSWNLSPSNNQTLETSSDGSILYIRKGTLAPLTNYSLEATVAIVGGLSTKQVYPFQIAAQPPSGNLQVSPASGTMYSTLFNINLTGLPQNKTSSIFLTVFGITQSSSLKPVQISQSNIQISTSGTFNMTTILPLVTDIYVQILDQLTGEQTIVTQNVQVKKSQEVVQWSYVAANLIALSNRSQQIIQDYYLLSSVARNCQNDYFANLTQDTDCISVTNQIMNSATEEILQLSQFKNSSQTVAATFAAISSMVSQTTMYDFLMDGNSSIQALNLLQTISQNVKPFQSCLQTDSFQQSFLQGISNLMVYQFALQNQTIIGRRLQANPQTMLNSLIQLKDTLLDQLCQINQNTQVVSVSLELLTKKYPINADVQDVVIQSQLNSQNIIVPIDKILASSAIFDNAATNVCLQVSFMKINPVKSQAYSNQTFQDLTFIQVNSLDNQNNKMLSLQGVQDLKSTPYRIKFNYNYQTNSFVNNITTCLAYDLSNGGNSWNSYMCSTSYTKTQIICDCPQMNDYLYGVGNDYTRKEVLGIQYTFELSWPFLVILILIVLFSLLLPCIAMVLDNKDHNSVEQSAYKVSDELIKYLQIQRGYPCEQQLFYKLKDIEIMAMQTQQLNFIQTLSMVRRNVHPIWSFFWKFDYGLKRLTRAAILQAQWAHITLMIFTIYCYGVGNLSASSRYLVTIFLALFCLNPPMILQKCIKTDIVVTKVYSQESQTTIEEVSLKDKNFNLKVTFVIFSILYQVFAFIISILYLTGAQNAKNSFRMPISDAKQVLIIWGITLFWGFFLLNEGLVWIVAAISLARARQLKNQLNDDHQEQCCGGMFAYVDFFCEIPIELCLDAMCVQKFKEENLKPDVTEPNQQTNNYDKTMEAKNHNYSNDVSKYQSSDDHDDTVPVQDRKINNEEISFQQQKSQDSHDLDLNDQSDEEQAMPKSARERVSAQIAPTQNPAPRTKLIQESAIYNQQKPLSIHQNQISEESQDSKHELAMSKYKQSKTVAQQDHDELSFDQAEQDQLDVQLRRKLQKDKKIKKEKKSKREKKKRPGSDDDEVDMF